MRREFGDILGIISRSHVGYVSAGVGCFLITVVILSYRLKVVFLGEGMHLKMSECVQLTFIGYFFNNFMPTAVGGDIMKAHCASKLHDDKLKSYTSVMMDRIIGLYSFLILAAVALLIDQGRFESTLLTKFVFALVMIGVVGFIIVSNRSVALFMEKLFARMRMFGLGEKLQSVYNIMHDYRNRLDVVAKSIAISLAGQSIYFVVVFIFVLALGAKISLPLIFLIMPVVTFISMMPSLGGLGAREGAIVLFLAPVVGKEIAFATSLLLLFSYFFISLVGGVAYFFWGLKETKRT
jgi:uncharacterized protein (TIRG00374 family)